VIFFDREVTKGLTAWRQREPGRTWKRRRSGHSWRSKN